MSAMNPTVADLGLSAFLPLTIQLEPFATMTQDQFFDFCQLNSDKHFERSAKGELIILPPRRLDTGSQLGWLIDPFKKKVHVSRPGRSVEILDDPASVSADPELPGFVLDLGPVWEP